VVVTALSDLIPAAIDAITNVVAVHVRVGATEYDVADTVGALVIRAIIVAVAVVADRVGTIDRHVAVGIASRALNYDVAVPVSGTPLVDRVSVAVATDNAPRAIDTAVDTDVAHGIG